MPAIVIGHAGDRNVAFDLDTLLRTRLLVQASSGGGKSWLIRRLAEQAFGKVPTVILDLEGEFSSLRERFDFILVGKGGDTPADVRSAPLLAHRLLEHGLSAVCDLFESPPADRHRWAAAFLTALVDAPKHLWRPMLVIIDEAHVFCPEKGAGESVASEAVTALATRGRKRGFCAVLATQRLGKLRKDTAAELQNVLIGRTTLDLDRDRAVDALGVSRAERTEFMREIKTLAPGQFYTFGRAFGGEADRVLIQVDGVQTTHPEPGARAVDPPPPTARIRHLLPQLADLPKEAEREAQTLDTLRAEVSRLQRLVAAGVDTRPAPPPVRVPYVPPALLDGLRGLRGGLFQWVTAVEEMIQQASAVPSPLPRDYAWSAVGREKPVPRATRPLVPADERRLLPPSRSAERRVDVQRADAPPSGDSSGTERRMLVALAGAPGGRLTKRQLATLAVVNPTKSTFRGAVARLKQAGHIDVAGDIVTITAAGRGEVGDVRPPSDRRELLAMWRDKMNGKAKDALELFATQHGPFTVQAIADEIGVDRRLSTFRGIMAQLRGNGLVRKVAGGLAVAEEIAL